MFVLFRWQLGIPPTSQTVFRVVLTVKEDSVRQHSRWTPPRKGIYAGSAGLKEPRTSHYITRVFAQEV